jgi:hypothetical protein
VNKILGMCMNWKVVAGLAAVGVGVWLFAPRLFPGILPLLFVAICPLSMLGMMWGMTLMSKASGTSEQINPYVQNGPNLDQQLAELKAQQEALARHIDQLEAIRTSSPLKSETPAQLSTGNTGEWLKQEG